MSVAHAAEGGYTRTNRILYEFGEIMRQKVHASDNAGCLAASGPCSVTIKY